jgi:hypothetical protein
VCVQLLKVTRGQGRRHNTQTQLGGSLTIRPLPNRPFRSCWALEVGGEGPEAIRKPVCGAWRGASEVSMAVGVTDDDVNNVNL